MSIEAMAWVLNESPARGTELLALLGVANHADRDGGNAWPSVATLARYCRVSESACRRALKRCVEAGWLHVEVQGGPAVVTAGGRQRLNRYSLKGVASALPPVDEGGRVPDARGSRSEPQGGRALTRPEPTDEPSEEPSTDNTALAPLDAFETFWQAYPRKIGKPAARLKYDRLLRVDPDGETMAARGILTGLGCWTRYWTEAHTETQFIPHPATWLHQRRFEDHPPPVVSNGSRRDRQVDALPDLVRDLPGSMFGGATPAAITEGEARRAIGL